MPKNIDNLTFSQRQGIAPIDIPFQLTDMNSDLRVSLWNGFYIYIHLPLVKKTYLSIDDELLLIYERAWIHFLKKPYDDFTSNHFELSDLIKNYIQKTEWNKVYEFFEFVFLNLPKEQYDFNNFIGYINKSLVSNHSGFRLINYKFIPITNDVEINEIQQVINTTKKFSLSGIQTHLNEALELLAKKPTPGFRNSIKESISMVEAISRLIEPKENTLGEALKKLDKRKKINPTLKAAFEKLYAYTNGENGIRHALMDDENLTTEDAKFFLVSCSAFTNYLIEKAHKENLLTSK